MLDEQIQMQPLKDPALSIDGLRMGFDTLGFGSFVTGIPWHVFCCLDWENVADTARFFLWA